MNDLTNILLTNHARYEVEEYVKPGNYLVFDSAKQQRVTNNSIPSLTLVITYKGLNATTYGNLRAAYEANYANTFKCDLNEFIDKRLEFMTSEASVWAFGTFNFQKTAHSCAIEGSITIITSVFFNFTRYQDLMNESSNNTLTLTSDTSFRDLLDTSSPNRVSYGYEVNTAVSNIGQSRRLTKDKHGLKRIYRLVWILKEPEFTALLTYYRKKSGIMGTFGIPDIQINESTLINANFKQDSMRYVKRLDGLYETALEIIESKGV